MNKPLRWNVTRVVITAHMKNRLNIFREWLVGGMLVDKGGCFGWWFLLIPHFFS